MQVAEFKKVEKEWGTFVEEFAPEFGRSERRYWCKLYLTGLLREGERKSIEPIAPRVPGGNEQALQQFVNQSPWAPEPVQDKLYRRLGRRSGQGKGVLIVDDTTLPKKGTVSVGVTRQYGGALGKVTNCQAIVTWHYSGPRAHVPLLGEAVFTAVMDYGPSQVSTSWGTGSQARVSREMDTSVGVARSRE